MPTMRAKMRVTGVEPFDGGEKLEMAAVGPKDSYPSDGADENNSYARWTPTATLVMYIQNPSLFGKFKVGQEFYLDFTEAV